MKRAIHVALAAFMLLGVIAGAGATPVAASTDVTYDDDNNGIDNDGFDIDDNVGSIIIDNSREDNDVLDLDLDVLS